MMKCGDLNDVISKYPTTLPANVGSCRFERMGLISLSKGRKKKEDWEMKSKRNRKERVYVNNNRNKKKRN